MQLDIHNDTRISLELSTLTDKPFDWDVRPAQHLRPNGRTRALIKTKSSDSNVEGVIGYSLKHQPEQTMYSIYFSNQDTDNDDYKVDVMTWDMEHIGAVSNVEPTDGSMTQVAVQLCKHSNLF